MRSFKLFFTEVIVLCAVLAMALQARAAIGLNESLLTQKLKTNAFSKDWRAALNDVANAVPNTNLVVIAPYTTTDPADSGAQNFGASAGETAYEWLNYPHHYRIRQAGTVQQVKLYVGAKTSLTAFYVKIWRKASGGTTYSLVGSSADILGSLTASNVNTVTVNIPGALEGDFVGGRAEYSAASVQNFHGHTVTGTSYAVSNTTPATNSFAWESQAALASSAMPIELYAQAPVMVATGDSIGAGHGLSTYDHYSFVETTDRTWLENSMPWQVARAFNWTYQNTAIGGQQLTNINARLTNDVISLFPKFALVHVGRNDVTGSTTLNQFTNHFEWMLSRLISNNITPIVGLMLGGNDLSSANCAFIDSYNDALVSLIKTAHPEVILVNPKPYLNTNNPSLGPVTNLYAFKAGFTDDNVHPSPLGYRWLAQAYIDAINAEPLAGGIAAGDILQLGDGSPVSPPLAFKSSPRTGWKPNGLNAWRYYVDGVGKIDIDSSGNIKSASDGGISIGGNGADRFKEGNFKEQVRAGGLTVTTNATIGGTLGVTGVSTLATVNAGTISTTDRTGSLDNIMPASPGTGAIAQYDGSHWVLLPRGSSGQVLTSGASTNSWQTPSAGGSAPTGTVVNSGASVAGYLSAHTDVSGTNVAPSPAISVSGTVATHNGPLLVQIGTNSTPSWAFAGGPTNTGPHWHGGQSSIRWLFNGAGKYDFYDTGIYSAADGVAEVGSLAKGRMKRFEAKNDIVGGSLVITTNAQIGTDLVVLGNETVGGTFSAGTMSTTDRTGSLDNIMPSSPGTGALAYYNGTHWVLLARGSAGQYLASTAGTIQYQAIQAADVPTLNQNTTGTAANITGVAAVANGGTGTSTLTGIVKGNGTSAFTAASAGTDFVAPGGAGSVTGLTTGNVPKASGATGLASSPIDISGTTNATLTGNLLANGGTLTNNVTFKGPITDGTGSQGNSGDVLKSGGAGASTTWSGDKGSYTWTFNTSSASLTASVTYYLGASSVSPGSQITQGRYAYVVPKPGTIKAFYWQVYASGGGDGTNVPTTSVFLNGTTSIGTDSTAWGTTFPLRRSSTGLSQAVTAGDTLEIKIVTPGTWTVPTATIMTFTVYIETTL